MAVPDFQSFMLPLLKPTGRWPGGPSRRGGRAARPGVPPIRRRPQGGTAERQTRLYNRVGWTTTYLRKAGLLERLGRDVSE